MRKTLLTLFLFVIFYSTITARTYYVAPTGGSDINAGTDINKPWATWQKAFDTANAGDTVFFRGGIWYPATTTFQAAICIIDPLGKYQPSKPRGHSGTKENPICYFNYPGEYPVLDCSKISVPGNYLEGISLCEQVHYIHFKGLEIKNIWQKGKLNLNINGISTSICSNITLENMSIHDLGGRGLWITSVIQSLGFPSDTSRLINCDFYNCADTLMDHKFNLGDGIKGDLEKGSVLIIDGCRFWNCSDDGVDLSGSGQKILNNCWAFNMGINYVSIYEPDDGNGFKLGGVRDSISIPNWTMTNCISAGNLRTAIHMLDYAPYYRNNARLYNSVFFKNGTGPWSLTNADKPFQNTEFYNCISYANIGYQLGIFIYPYPESHNNWDYYYETGNSTAYKMTDTVTVTNSDFLSLDINELSRPRQADGSLPDVNFMRLVASSDLKDAGINVGLPYTGKAPDIGCSEFLESNALHTLKINNYSPNPTTDVVNVDFYSPKNTPINIAVINNAGNTVLTMIVQAVVGNSNKTVIDLTNLPTGIYSIRLDDGTAPVAFSLTKKDKEAPIEFKILNSFPNPTKDLLYIEFTCPLTANVTIEVKDETTHVVLSKIHSASKGFNKVFLNLSSLQKGNYTIILNTGNTYDDISVSKL